MYHSNENSGNYQPYYCVQTSGYYVTSLQVTGQTSSWILYSSVVPHYCKDKELIERVQRRFTRMIPDLNNLSYEQRLAETKLWSLEDRRTRADLTEVYKIFHGLSAVRFNTFFELSHNERTRGHSLKLHKKRVMTDLRHFFLDRIVNKWNSLSEDIISASSLNNFKGKLQRLYNDGSSTGFFKSAWPSGLSQFPGEAQSGKLSGKQWSQRSYFSYKILLFLDLSYKILLLLGVLVFPTFLQFPSFIEYLFCVILSVMIKCHNFMMLWQYKRSMSSKLVSFHLT